MKRNFDLYLPVPTRIGVVFSSLIGLLTSFLYAQMTDTYIFTAGNILFFIIPILVVVFLGNHVGFAIIFSAFGTAFNILITIFSYPTAFVSTALTLFIALLSLVLYAMVFLALFKKTSTVRIKLFAVAIFFIKLGMIFISIISLLKSDISSPVTMYVYLFSQIFPLATSCMLVADIQQRPATRINFFLVLLVIILCVGTVIGLPRLLNRIDLDLDFSSKTKVCDSCGGDGELVSYLVCSNCGGNGEETRYCVDCNGEGVYRLEPCYSCSGSGKITVTCEHCNGTGQIYDPFPCHRCDGSGTVPKYN